MNVQIFLASKLSVMIFFSEHFQQLMWKNSRPVSNSARVSFNTVTFQYSSVGTRRKTHFWVQGGDFFFFHHILLKTGSPDCDSTDFWFFIFHHLPSCLPPFSNSQFYSWCKKTLLASNKTLNEIQERGSIDCIWLQSHFNPFPPACPRVGLTWTAGRGGGGVLTL